MGMHHHRTPGQQQRPIVRLQRPAGETLAQAPRAPIADAGSRQIPCEQTPVFAMGSLESLHGRGHPRSPKRRNWPKASLAGKRQSTPPRPCGMARPVGAARDAPEAR
jgi:hypothetical protein